MFANLRYVFDLNNMQFIFPMEEHPYGPFKISLVFNGIDIDKELNKVKFQNYVLLKLIAETEDKWERLQLEEAMHYLEVQKNILLQNMLKYLQQFWSDLEERNYDIRCPNCGKLYFIKYNIYFEEEEDEDEEEGEDEEGEEKEVEDEEKKLIEELLKNISVDRCTSAAG
ncbi:unnamed protein product [Pieris brassicae]|uniref:Uncharacterized protein n=1 Tax=Pieris brassicae TaxID=7116 RepID=A0A9P0U0K5_PIEBR|nr:unnamed protein product [Pieris brassicae]